MNCKKCGASWKLGNILPQMDCCPICDIDFQKMPSYKNFDTIVELLQFLVAQNGTDYWNNDRGINGYLNDYFPEKSEIRNQIRFLLEKQFGKRIIEWYQDIPDKVIIKEALESIQFQGDINAFSEGIMLLVGASTQKGTDIKSPVFYMAYAHKCKSIEYKIKALEKAVLYGAGEETKLELADLKLKRNPNEGMDAFNKLVEQGSIESLLRLAKIYEQGKIIEKNYLKEIDYLNKAVLQNSAEGMYQLGRLYMLGRGLKKSNEKAIELFEKASEQNHEKANFQLYSIYYNSEKENFKQLALVKLQYAAKAEYLPAMYEYALHLLYGEHTLENVPMAVTILENCALQGCEEAIEKLCYMYSAGYKVARDKLKALKWQDRLKGGC